MTAPALGALRSPDDARDWRVEDRIALAAVMPAAFGTPVAPSVLNQGSAPSCVGFSGAAARTINEYPEARHEITFDGTDLYKLAKLRDGIPNEPGTYIRIACKVLATTGAKAIRGGSGRYKIKGYARASMNVDSVKQAIYARGFAWVCGDWGVSWSKPIGGILPKWDRSLGGHAFLLIGWDDSRKAFWLQNSWGTKWGISGRAWLPYSQLGHIWEAWTTVDASNPSEADMVPFTVTDSRSHGVGELDGNPATRLIRLADEALIVPPAMVILGAAGTLGGRYPGDAYLCAVGPDLCAVLARNLKTIAPPTSTTFSINGAVGDPTATIFWR